MKLKSPYLVKPHAKIRLSRLAADETGQFKHEDAAKDVLDGHRKDLSELQEILYASKQKALLIASRAWTRLARTEPLATSSPGSTLRVATSPASASLLPRKPSMTSSGAFMPRFHGGA